MSNEQAKAQFQRAEELSAQKRYQEALDILEGLYQVLPGSRRVMYQRALCLIGLERYDEALADCEKLEGKLEAKHLDALREKIARHRPAVDLDLSDDVGMPTQAMEPVAASALSLDDSVMNAPLLPPKGGRKPAPIDETANVFQAESVFPLSTEETTVTGRVLSGAFYTGDSVSVIPPSGMPLLVPIVRIGSAETPIRVLRQGQQGMMVLHIESQNVAPGTRITSTASSDAYAETMVVSAGSKDAGGDEPVPAAIAPVLQEVESLLNERRFALVKEKLDELLKQDPFNGAAYRLLSRVHLEADDEFQDNKKALQYIQKAYELGGDKDPVVLEILAKALGANGRGEQGIRYLERLYSMETDEEAKAAIEKRVNSYRARFRLGNVWEFMNQWGDVIFESGNIDEIEKALTNGSIPKDAQCRKNKTGEFHSIPDELVPEFPQLATFYRKAKLFTPQAVMIGAAVGLILGVVASIFVAAGENKMAVTAGIAVSAGAVGAAIGFALGSQLDAKNKKVGGKKGSK